MKKTTCVGVAVLLAGCSQLSVLNFEKSEYSGIKDNKLAFVLIEQGGDNDALLRLASVIGRDEDLRGALSKVCKVSAEKTKALALPPAAFATVGKLLFDLFMDNQVRRAEGLKKAAQGAYSDKLQISGANLQKKNCALAVRYKENDKDYGLVALVELQRQADGRSFVMQPVFVRAKNAVVVTEKPSDGKPAVIGVAIAMSLKGIVRQRTNAPSLQSLGEGVVAVPRLELGPLPPAVTCPEACTKSDLIPYPERGNEVVSIALSIAEAGKISIDFDQSIAELKAIKEAIGPVIKETLKEALSD